MRVDRGTIRVRPGRVRHCPVPAGLPAPPRTLGAFSDNAGARLALAAGTKLFLSDTTQSAWSEVAGLTLDGTRAVRLQQAKDGAFHDALYVVDGSDQPVRKWTPDGGVNSLVEAACSTEKPALTEEYTGQDLGSLCFAGNDHAGLDDGAVLDGNDHWVLPTGSGWAWRGFAYTTNTKELRAVGVRRFTTPALMPEGKSSVLGVELMTNITHDLETMSGSGTMVQRIAEDSQPLDLSRARKILLTLRVRGTEGQLLPEIRVQLGTHAPDGSGNVSANTLSLNPNTLGMQNEQWATVELPVTGLSPTELGRITHVAIQVDPRNTVQSWPSTRFEYDADVFAAGYTCALTVFIADLQIYIEGQSGYLPATLYDVCYTLETADGEGRPSPEAQLMTGSEFTLPRNVRITCPVPAGITPSAVNVYARGGVSADWRKVGTAAFDATSNSAVGNWDGSYPSGADLLDQYIQPPPSGCHLLLEHKGRMVYAKGDTLYISNWNDPDRVPQEMLLELQDDYGGWVRVGTDGDAIIGLGRLGSYLVVFKRRGMWLFEGEDASSFAVTPVSQGHGCSSHESIAQIDGGLLVWRDGAHVWAWDGQNFRDLGEPIGPLLAAHTPVQQAASFAVYDPAERQYLLTVPGATAAASYVFECRTGTWNPLWSGQPGGCAAYLDCLATPGIYAVERVTSGFIYQLNAGTTDATATAELPIAFSWMSGALSAPTPLLRKDVRRLGACVSVLPDITLRVRRDGETWDSAARTVSTGDGYAEWSLPALPTSGNYYVGVAGSSSAGGEITRLDVHVQAKGRL